MQGRAKLNEDERQVPFLCPVTAVWLRQYGIPVKWGRVLGQGMQMDGSGWQAAEPAQAARMGAMECAMAGWGEFCLNKLTWAWLGFLLCVKEQENTLTFASLKMEGQTCDTMTEESLAYPFFPLVLPTFFCLFLRLSSSLMLSFFNFAALPPPISISSS